MSSQNSQRGRPPIQDDGKIVDAVTDTFWQNGYVETSISDLSDASGASRASLYKLYGEKPSLLAAAIDRYAERFDARVAETLLRTSDVEEAVATTLAASADRLTDPDAPNGCLRCRTTLELKGQFRLVDAALERANARFEANMARLLNADGRERASDIATARLLTAVVNGIVVLAETGASRSALEDVISGVMIVVRSHI